MGQPTVAPYRGPDQQRRGTITPTKIAQEFPFVSIILQHTLSQRGSLRRTFCAIVTTNGGLITQPRAISSISNLLIISRWVSWVASDQVNEEAWLALSKARSIFCLAAQEANLTIPLHSRKYIAQPRRSKAATYKQRRQKIALERLF